MVREIAKDLNIDLSDVERIAREVDRHDVTKTGILGKEEFGRLLRRLTGAQDEYDLPQHRIETFWRQLEIDGGVFDGGVRLREIVFMMVAFFGLGKEHLICFFLACLSGSYSRMPFGF